MKKILFVIFVLEFTSATIFSQHLEWSADIPFKKPGYSVNIIGSNDDATFVMLSSYEYLKYYTLYRFDNDLNLVAQKEINLKFDNKSGYLKEKNVVVLSDQLLAAYVVKVGNKAVVYGDEINPETFEIASVGNVLYEYEYEKMVNSQLITFDSYPVSDGLILHMRIHGLESAVKAGNDIGVVLKLNNDLEKVYTVTYEEDVLGYTPRANTNGLVDKDERFIFYSSNPDLGVLNLNIVDSEGNLVTKGFKTNSKKLDCFALSVTDEVIICGQYFTGENDYFEGIFVARESESEIRYHAFGSSELTRPVSVDYLRRRDFQNPRLDVRYSASNNSIFIVWDFDRYDKQGQILVAQFNPAANSLKSIVISAEEERAFSGQYSFISADKLAIIAQSDTFKDKMCRWELFEIDVNEISVVGSSVISTDGIADEYQPRRSEFIRIQSSEQETILYGWKSFRLARVTY
jgi:hypothetical protein